MNFTSPVFFLFLPVVVLLYRIIAQRYRYLLLLGASYLFYAFYDVRLLLLILITTLVSYLCALAMEQTTVQKKKRLFMFLTLAVCLGILFLFKYLNFTLHSIFALCNLLGGEISFSGFQILLPMGISFYVFQTMSYVFDVYRGNWSAQRHLGYYALFIVFFPQLVAGPIERPKDLLPQFQSPPPFCLADFTQGFGLMLRGYGKKLLIADYVAIFVDAAYSNIPTAGGMTLAVATLLFALQIYCDFSGYSDIALGCTKFLGIRLSENFHHPYAATSIRDFWRRWHISLTRWFTDYLYIPMGGSQKGTLRHCLNILITFLVSGLWHGANWTFVIWGGLHGIYLIVETLFGTFLRNKKTPVWVVKTAWISPLKRLATFLLVCFAWIFFRSATIDDAIHIIYAIFTDWQPATLLSGLQAEGIDFILLLIMPLILLWLERLPAFPLTNVPVTRAHTQCLTALFYLFLVLAIMLCRCMLLAAHGNTSFLYFQF